jgi:hypothetical protein
MGEAKRNRDQLKKIILGDLDRYERPMTPEENELRRVIEALPVVTVQRAPHEQLTWARMKPRECHANARFMEKNDPNRLTKQILGWMVSPHMFVLHSIIDQNGQLICVTPHVVGETFSGDEFEFAPDPALEMVLEPVSEGAKEQKFRIERNGVSVMDHKEVRRDMTVVAEISRKMRECLNQGMHPREAIERATEQRD